tara:strand:- start:612 stop:1646 length:1035 start_codon:yes stop_codon:yes gene_type:complete
MESRCALVAVLVVLAVVAAPVRGDCPAGCSVTKHSWTYVSDLYENQDKFPHHVSFRLDSRDTARNFVDYQAGDFGGDETDCRRRKPENVYLYKAQKQYTDNKVMYVTFVDAWFEPTLEKWYEYCERLFNPATADLVYFVELDESINQQYRRDIYNSFHHVAVSGYYVAEDETCDITYIGDVNGQSSSCESQFDGRTRFNTAKSVLPSSKFCDTYGDYSSVTVAFDCDPAEKTCKTHYATNYLKGTSAPQYPLYHGMVQKGNYNRDEAKASFRSMRGNDQVLFLQKMAISSDRSARGEIVDEDDCWFKDDFTFAFRKFNSASALLSVFNLALVGAVGLMVVSGLV